jgi:hypothetical protein
MYARKYKLLWCLFNELCSSDQQAKLTCYRVVHECNCGDYPTGDVNSQEDNNKEDEHVSRTLVHGM